MRDRDGAGGSERGLARLRDAARCGAWAELRQAAEACAEAIARSLEATLLVAEAELRQGDFAAARDRLERAVADADRRGDAAHLRRAVNMFGAALFELGQLGSAEAAFERALSEANAHGDHLTAGRATNNLGLVANVRGRHEAALALYRLAVPSYQRAGHTAGLGETHHNIAITLRDLNRFDEADRHERRAIAFAHEMGDRRLQAMARVGRAELCLLRGEPVLAIAGARLAAEDYGTVPDPVGQADALRLIGLAQTSLGESGPAGQALGRALALAERHGSSLIRAETLRARAGLFLHLGNLRDAEADVRQALEIFDQLGARRERRELEAWWSASR